MIETHLFSFLGIFGLDQLYSPSRILSCHFSTRSLSIVDHEDVTTTHIPRNKKRLARDVVSWYKCFSHPSIMDSNHPQNLFCLIVVLKRNFQSLNLFCFTQQV